MYSVHVVYGVYRYWLNCTRELTVLYWTRIMKLILCCFRVLYCFAQRPPQEGRSHPIPRQQADKTAGGQPCWEWSYSNGKYRDSELECDFLNVGSKWHKAPWEVTVSERLVKHWFQFVSLFTFQKHWNQSDLNVIFGTSTWERHRIFFEVNIYIYIQGVSRL